MQVKTPLFLRHPYDDALVSVIVPVEGHEVRVVDLQPNDLVDLVGQRIFELVIAVANFVAQSEFVL